MNLIQLENMQSKLVSNYQIGEDMKTYHWIATGLGLLMFLVSIWQLETADSGLEITHLQEEQIPITLITPGVEDASTDQ